MKKWNVSLPWHAAVFVRGVKAKTAEEAIEQAKFEASPSLCHYCTKDVELGEVNEDEGAEAIEI